MVARKNGCPVGADINVDSNQVGKEFKASQALMLQEMITPIQLL